MLCMLKGLQLCWILSFTLPVAIARNSRAPSNTAAIGPNTEGSTTDTTNIKKGFFELGGIGVPIGPIPVQDTRHSSARNGRIIKSSLASRTGQGLLGETRTTQLAPATLTESIVRSVSPSSTVTTSSSPRTSATTTNAVTQPQSLVTSTARIPAMSPLITAQQISRQEATQTKSGQGAAQQVSGQDLLGTSPTPTPAPTPVQSEVAGAVPVLPDEREAISPMGQLGISFGVTFAVLAIAAAVAITIWYRRRHPKLFTQVEDEKQGKSLREYNPLLLVRGFFDRKKAVDIKNDPEWSIESAEQVSIVKHVQAQSVTTLPRSSSRNSNQSSVDTGMKTTTRTRPSGPALTSHPITPEIVQLTDRQFDAAVDEMNEKTVAQKPNEWPLSR